MYLLPVQHSLLMSPCYLIYLIMRILKTTIVLLALLAIASQQDDVVF
jgi:hypothetical protein